MSCSGTTSEAGNGGLDLAHVGQCQLQAQLTQQLPQQLPQTSLVDEHPVLGDVVEQLLSSETMQQQQEQQLLQRYTVCLAQDTLELPILALITETTSEPGHSLLDAKQQQLQLVELGCKQARLLSANASEVGQTHTSLVSELGLGNQHYHAQGQPDEEEQAASEGALIKVSFCLVGHQHVVFDNTHSPILSCFRQSLKKLL